MNQKVLFAGIIVALLGVLAGGFIVKSPAIGGVASTETYYATTTSSADASDSVSWTACKGSCVLGSIIINDDATAGYVRIWDATSTATSTYVSDVASSTRAITIGREIAKIAADAVEGTLVYDIRTNNGIVIETYEGFDGQYVVTWKQ